MHASARGVLAGDSLAARCGVGGERDLLLHTSCKLHSHISSRLRLTSKYQMHAPLRMWYNVPRMELHVNVASRQGRLSPLMTMSWLPKVLYHVCMSG